MTMNKKRKGRRAQGQMEQKAKLDSASEIASQYDAEVSQIEEAYPRNPPVSQIGDAYPRMRRMNLAE